MRGTIYGRPGHSHHTGSGSLAGPSLHIHCRHSTYTSVEGCPYSVHSLAFSYVFLPRLLEWGSVVWQYDRMEYGSMSVSFSPSMSASPFAEEHSLLLVSVLNISSTNLMRTSSDIVSIPSLQRGREKEGGEGGREGETCSPQNKFTKHLSPFVHLWENTMLGLLSSTSSLPSPSS